MMKILLIVYFVTAYILIILHGLRNKVWVKWLWYSVTYKIQIYKVKRNLTSLSKDAKFWALMDWLDEEHWFKNYWFGKRVKKIVLKELAKY